MTELLNNVRPEMSEAAKKAASVYLYLFQTLTDIQLHDSIEKVNALIADTKLTNELIRSNHALLLILIIKLPWNLF